MNEIHSIEASIFWNPLILTSIKSPGILRAIDDYLPYSTGFEIECNWLPNFNIKEFESIPDIMHVDCDGGEQRFRIPKGLKGLICLYNISEALKRNCSLNLSSGIHYHVDMTDIYDVLTNEVIQENSDWILKRLDEWKYDGAYNSRSVCFGIGSTWMRFQSGFKTAEIRIGEMTFDYNVLSKRIIDANSIIRELRETIGSTIEEMKMIRLERELSSLKEVKLPKESLNELNTIINKRKTIIINVPKRRN